MNSKSERFPNGMGNDSGALGHYLMDHHFKAGASASIEGYEDMYYKGRRLLNEEVRDKYGMNTLTFDCEWKENELNMQDAMMNDCAEMLDAAGYKNINPYKGGSYPGLGIHEMGTARMGRDPKTSVLNGNNQIHAVENVYITDGACMTSSACQNPSITYIALTARACDHAVKELKRQNL